MNRYILAALLFLSVSPAYAQKDGPLPPRVAAMKMTLPTGFKATLFAGEPDLVQPIAFTFDDRGHVIEGIEYPDGSLTGTGTIDGHTVRCINPEHLVKFHCGYELKDKDFKDVVALCDIAPQLEILLRELCQPLRGSATHQISVLGDGIRDRR